MHAISGFYGCYGCVKMDDYAFKLGKVLFEEREKYDLSANNDCYMLCWHLLLCIPCALGSS